MALTLNVVRNGLVLRSAVVPKGDLSIGRGTSCDLPIDDQPHDDLLACVKYWNGEYVIVDEGCKSVVVGNVSVGPHAARVIRIGDVIQIDGTDLRLQDTTEATEPVIPAISDGILFERRRSGTRNEGTHAVAVVRVVEGPSIGRDLVITDEKEYFAGRHGSCDLVLDDMEVSRRHLRIWQSASETFIADIGSSGTRLGTRDLSPGEPTGWTQGMMVRLGRSVIALDR